MKHNNCPRNLELVQLDLEADTYREMMREWDENPGSVYVTAPIVERLPRYTLARCPYCNQPYQERIDTYSLRRYVPQADRGRPLFGSDVPPNACEHQVLVSYFWNFEGRTLEYSRDELYNVHVFPPEAPHFLEPIFGTDEIETRAVIHALPVCKLVGENFVPSYTLYSMTYFSDQPYYAETLMHAANYRFRLAPPDELPQNIDHLFELEQYVRSGHLFWMEGDASDMKRMSGEDGKFPYANIEGRRQPYWENPEVISVGQQ